MGPGPMGRIMGGPLPGGTIGPGGMPIEGPVVPGGARGGGPLIMGLGGPDGGPKLK